MSWLRSRRSSSFALFAAWLIRFPCLSYYTIDAFSCICLPAANLPLALSSGLLYPRGHILISAICIPWGLLEFGDSPRETAKLTLRKTNAAIRILIPFNSFYGWRGSMGRSIIPAATGGGGGGGSGSGVVGGVGSGSGVDGGGSGGE
ncbi:hypothetical protein L6452_15801 [Arctium lappa]|uniref:Uncharacterized protein n=1 Tax=Arctium lappa TaxID=4217 RepID=A0ACB9CQ24_ARCLA|nr:hypothetical protein L6452_15801 [Arctium lappa]